MHKNYSVSMRIWHWLNVVVIIGLLGTFFLRKTFLSWKTNSFVISEKLGSFGIEVTAEQAAAIAKAIRAPMWEWHIIFGVMLALLLLVRVLILWQEKGFGYDDQSSMHMRMVYWGYKIFYLILIFMAVSGVILTWHDSFGISKELVHTIKEQHELIAWTIVVFVPLHIIGVVVAEYRGQKNIISKMISG